MEVGYKLINALKINNFKSLFKYVILFIFFVLSVLILYFLYIKTSFKIYQIKDLYVLNYKELIFANFITLIAFIIKAYRWKLIVDSLTNKNIEFLKFLYLSSVGALLNSVGLSIVISDGIKSTILSFDNLKDDDKINKIKGILSSYGDRILGIIAASFLLLILSTINFNFIFIILGVIGLSFSFLAIRYLDIKVFILSLVISFISHILDAFSMYFIFVFVLKQSVSFYIWLLAHLVGSIFSVFSIFGGLGTRTIGLSYIINNIKNNFYIDIFYYLFQVFNAFVSLILFLFILLIKKLILKISEIKN
ncbi:MAG: hypothetical protein ACPL1F_06375 [bacterium]